MVGCDPSALLRTGLRVVFGPGDFQQVVPECPAVVGYGENVLLDSEVDGVGVERVWTLVLSRMRDVVGLWISAFAGMTVGRVGVGGGAEGLVEGVVDLGHEPSGLVDGRFMNRPNIVVVGFGGRVGAWLGLGINLLGGFAECSVGEGCVGGDAVVSGGLFVGTIGDFVEYLDELDRAVGHIEDGLGEVEGGVG